MCSNYIMGIIMKRSQAISGRTRRLGKIMFSVTLPALSAGAIIVPSAVVAAEASYTFAIESNTLQQSLMDIAHQSNKTLSFNPELVEGYPGKALHGTYTVHQAILAQLAGTSLTVKQTDNGTLTIETLKTADSAAAARASGQTLPAITVSGSGDDDANTFNPSTSSSATRTEMALQQTPESVKVISKKVLDERQATSLDDALRNSAGVMVQESNRGGSTYWIRGYEVKVGATDGVANTSTTYNGGIANGTQIEGVERVEVLKGPQAVMAGSSTPSGSINVVRKSPVTDPLHVLKFEAASHGEFKTAVDLGGPLNDDRSISYRLNASSMTSQTSYPDFNGNHADYLAPVIGWEGDTTRIKVGTELSNSRNSGPAGTYYANGHIQKPPRYRLGDKDDHFTMSGKNAYYELEHQFSDGWSFSSKANYQSTSNVVKLHEAYGIEDDGTVIAHPFSNKQTLQSWSLQNDVRGKIETGPITQNVVLGYDFQYSRNNSYDVYRSGPLDFSGNINDPDSMRYPDVADPDYLSYRSKAIQNGVLLQDQVDLWDRAHFMVSVKRASWNNSYLVGKKYSTYKGDKWIPNYGLSYELTPEVTAYVNLLKSFQANNSVSVNGDVLPPTNGTSKEAGLKFSLLDDSLSLTTAVFTIDEKNLLVTDRTGQTIGTEGRKSKGADIDLSGSPLPGWNITASYTYADIEPVAETEKLTTGQARHSGSLWSSYEIQSGELQGLGAGIGFNGTSSTMNGYSPSYFKIGGWVQTDASIFYHQKNWSLALGVKNLFDRDIYYTSTSPLYIGAAQGRNYRLTATYSF